MRRLLAALVLLGVALAGTPVTVTYYWPSPEQTDGAPEVGSCGPVGEWERAMLPGERLIALSRDLFFQDGHKRCGLRVRVRLTDGTVIDGVVWDTMAARWTRRVDVLYQKGQRPRWGRARGTLFVVGYAVR